MKIVYLHQYFKTPAMAGGTRSYEMARRMAAAGHDVHVVTSQTDGNKLKSKKEIIDGFTVHWISIPYDNKMGILKRLLSFVRFSIASAPQAASLQPDIVFATSTPLSISIPGTWASWRNRCPMVLEVRDLWPEVPIAMGAFTDPLSKRLLRAFEKWSYFKSDHIIALSEGMRDGVLATGYPLDRTSVIPNSCDIELFQSTEPKADNARRKRPWLASHPLVLYAGTFGKANGVDYLVDIARDMVQLNPNVRFLAVGAGAQASLIREKADKLKVLGANFFIEDQLPKHEATELFSAATLCMSLFIPLEALWKNSANKVFDAFAAGRPVAINYKGWQAELIEQEQAGLVIPASDSKRAAEKISQFLSDQEKIDRAKEASGRLAARFSRDKLAKQLISVLETTHEAAHNQSK